MAAPAGFDWKVPATTGYTGSNGIRGMCINPNDTSEYRVLLGTRTILPVTSSGFQYTKAQLLPELASGWTYAGITISGSVLYASVHSSSDHEVHAFDLTTLSAATPAKYTLHADGKMTGSSRTSIHRLNVKPSATTNPSFYFLRYNNSQNTLDAKWSQADGTAGGSLSAGVPSSNINVNRSGFTLSFNDHWYGLGFGLANAQTSRRFLFSDIRQNEYAIIEYRANDNVSRSKLGYMSFSDNPTEKANRSIWVAYLNSRSRYVVARCFLNKNIFRIYTLSQAASSSFTSQAATSADVTALTAPPDNTGSDFFGTITNFSGTGTTYTATYTAPSVTGTATISVEQNVTTEGNAAASNNIPVTDPLTATITPRATSIIHGQPVTIDIVFSKAVTDFAVGDITASAGTLSSFTGSGTTYSVVLTAPTTGTTDITLSIPIAGVANLSAAPTATLTLASNTPTITAPVDVDISGTATISVDFEAPVTGFAAGDITLSAGTVSNLMGSGSSYTFTLNAPSSGTSLTIDISAGVVNEGNAAAPQVTVNLFHCTWTSLGSTVPRHVFTGLDHNRTYTIYVRGTNSVGDGVKSNTTATTTSITATIVPRKKDIHTGLSTVVDITFSDPVTGLTLDDIGVAYAED